MLSSPRNVLTIGSFDILHYGHVDFLLQCQRLGTLTVGVNTDSFICQFKAAPTMRLDERVYALKQLGFSTVINDGPGRELIDTLRPDILAVGSDWARKDYLKQLDVSHDWLDERHIILCYVPYVQHAPISSSEIKRRVRDA